MLEMRTQIKAILTSEIQDLISIGINMQILTPIE